MPEISPIIRLRFCGHCEREFVTPHGGRWAARFCSQACTDTHRRQASRRMGKPESFTVTDEQRAAIHGKACVVCRRAPCHPAHLIDRSVCADQGDPRAVFPLCPTHHRAYDEGDLDVLPFLEPHWREQLAFAVERYGLLRTLERVTNQHWTTEGTKA